MITFFCVGFHDLVRCFNNYGHVQNHKIYMNREEADREACGKVVSVYEFRARNQAHLDSLIFQNEKMLESFK